MTLMNMGITRSAFKDLIGGRYQGQVTVAMAELWRVTAMITPQ